jgi:peptidyl-prolyl cis-trans isomerase SurA
MKQLAVFVCAVVLGGVPARGSAQTPAPGAPTGPSAPTQSPAPGVPAASAPPAAPDLSTGPRSVIVERVLVRVNGEILTQGDLTQRQIEVLRAQAQNQRQRTDAELRAEIAKLTPQILVSAIDELLLVQRGREMGVRFSDDQFNRFVEDLKKDHNLDDAKFKEALAAEGMTLEQLRQQTERSYLAGSVRQREIAPSMTITQEEQRQYYEKNRARFMTTETVTLRELLLVVPTRNVSGKEVTDPADEAAVKTRIAEIKARAEKGEDFAALARSLSESATKANGGLIGPLNLADLNPTLSEMLSKMQAGQVTEPIRAGRGFQLFKLESRATPQLRPFDSVRSEIEAAIREERLEPEVEKMLARLRTSAVIEWKDDSYRQMYEGYVREQGQQ